MRRLAARYRVSAVRGVRFRFAIDLGVRFASHPSEKDFPILRRQVFQNLTHKNPLFDFVPPLEVGDPFHISAHNWPFLQFLFSLPHSAVPH